MEDIILSIVPVRERSTIRTRLLNRSGWFIDLVDFTLCSLALLPLKLRFICRCKIHPVWVDNFALFLQVEGLLVRFHFRLDQLAVEVLAIV